MKIDMFAHILPKKYYETLCQKVKTGVDLPQLAPWVRESPGLREIDLRLRMMERDPDVVQVLTVVLPPLDAVVSPADAVELARIANDEMAELVVKYPDRMIGAAACLPLNDIDAAVKEADRAITELGFRGVQIFSNINGEPLDAPKFRPLYERMAQHDLPIWIHPWNLPVTGPPSKDLPKSIQEYFKEPIIERVNWPIDTTLAMIRLALSGIFADYPNIKFITHHCGGMVPFHERRIRRVRKQDELAGSAIEDLRKFYADTAVFASTPALMCGYAFFGADHLVFGTDWMGHDPDVTSEAMRSVERMAIPDMDKHKILEDNAGRLLKLTV